MEEDVIYDLEAASHAECASHAEDAEEVGTLGYGGSASQPTEYSEGSDVSEIFEGSDNSEGSDVSDNSDNSDSSDCSDNSEGSDISEAEKEIERMVGEMGAETLLQIIRDNRNAAIRQIISEVEASRPKTIPSGASAGRRCSSIFDLAALA